MTSVVCGDCGRIFKYRPYRPYGEYCPNCAQARADKEEREAAEEEWVVELAALDSCEDLGDLKALLRGWVMQGMLR